MAEPSLAVEPQCWETKAPLSGDGHSRKHPLENGTSSVGRRLGTIRSQQLAVSVSSNVSSTKYLVPSIVYSIPSSRRVCSFTVSVS